MLLDVITGVGLTLVKAILGPLFYAITPLTLSLGFTLLKFQYGVRQQEETVKIPWAIHYRDAIDLNYANDIEFAFPIDINNPTIINAAVQDVIEVVQEFIQAG